MLALMAAQWQIPAAVLIVVVLLLVAMGWLIWHWSKSGLMSSEIIKLMFGFVLLLLISGLAIVTLTLAEDAKNDPQISQILTMLSVLSGSFAQWAFSSGSKEKDKEPPK